MKKRIQVSAAFLLSVSLLTACGQSQAQTNNVPQSSVSVAQEKKTVTPINQESLQNNQKTNSSVTVETSSYIGEERAMAIALEHAGVKPEDLLFSNVKLDMDDGIWFYDVEFYAGNKEYDYEIDAAAGTIISFDYDMEGYFDPNTVQNNNAAGTAGNTPANAAAVSMDTARQTALAQVPGATADNIRIYTDYDDGRLIYEGKIIYNSMEYEFEIDANTGSIISWDAESIYD